MPRGQAPSPVANNARMKEAKKQYRQGAYGGPVEAKAKETMRSISRIQSGDSMASRIAGKVTPVLKRAKAALDRNVGNNQTTPKNQLTIKLQGKKKRK